MLLPNFSSATVAAAAAPDPGATPNIAQIILPPGLSLAQYENLQYYAVAISICVASAFTLVGWDYVVLLRDELRVYTTSNKQLWKQPATWAFIVLRYSAFLATFPALFFTSLQSQHCQAAVIASQVGAVLVVGCAGIIFCNRVVAIYSNSKVIIGALALLWSGMMSCWIAVASQYSATTGPPTPFGSNCQMKDIVSWAPISYASSVGFDVVILLLTVAKLDANASSFAQSVVSKQIYRDNLLYFFVTAVTNISVLSIQALDSSDALIKPTAVPFSTVITVTMAQRVYLNLKLFHQRSQRAEVGLRPSLPSQQSTSGMSSNSYPLKPMTDQDRVWDMSVNGSDLPQKIPVTPTSATPMI
ncbi:hypothetical protein DFH07DRAFT_958549 [Mycena maculata]|uniref:DUF6533 domain-containing protein n=1 Tax=Mycena maculata TaxID=230809 RepID=A0AAD7NF77_9AGAR|nr:hypothetical protein DFH07DRAFT_958549 [Mycena maculata]